MLQKVFIINFHILSIDAPTTPIESEECKNRQKKKKTSKIITNNIERTKADALFQFYFENLPNIYKDYTSIRFDWIRFWFGSVNWWLRLSVSIFRGERKSLNKRPVSDWLTGNGPLDVLFVCNLCSCDFVARLLFCSHSKQTHLNDDGVSARRIR